MYELEILIDNLTECSRPIASKIKRKYKSNEMRESSMEKKKASIYFNRLLGIDLPLQKLNQPKADYVTIQKSRLYTSKFDEFDLKVQKYNEALLQGKYNNWSVSQKSISKVFKPEERYITKVPSMNKIDDSASTKLALRLPPIPNRSNIKEHSYQQEILKTEDTTKHKDQKENYSNFFLKNSLSSKTNAISNLIMPICKPNCTYNQSVKSIHSQLNLQELDNAVRTRNNSGRAIAEPEYVTPKREDPNTSSKAEFKNNPYDLKITYCQTDQHQPHTHSKARVYFKSPRRDSKADEEKLNNAHTKQSNVPNNLLNFEKEVALNQAHNRHLSVISKSEKKNNESPQNLDINDLEGINSDRIEYNFRAFYKHNRSKFQERVTKGPPSSYRWISWIIASDIPEERNENLYNINFLSYVPDPVDIQIKKDLNRTIPETFVSNLSQAEIAHKEFILYKLLKSFAANDPEVAYCQGMNYIANFLLINSDYNEVDTFYLLLSLFSETFNSNLGIRGFYTQGFGLLNYYVQLFHHCLAERSPRLSNHLLNVVKLEDFLWINKWFMTLFTTSFPFEVVSRIWDCLIANGLDFLVKFTLSYLNEIEIKLLKMDDMLEVIDFFKSLSPYDNSDLVQDLFPATLSTDNQLNLSPAVSNSSIRIPFKLNFEAIILNALKINIPDPLITNFKKSYEKSNNLNLKGLHLKYDLNKTIDTISICESNYYSNSANNSKDDIVRKTKPMLSDRNLPDKALIFINKSDQAKSNQELEGGFSPELKQPQADELIAKTEPHQSSRLDDDGVESEVGDDIESKICMYKFTFNSKNSIKSTSYFPQIASKSLDFESQINDK